MNLCMVDLAKQPYVIRARTIDIQITNHMTIAFKNAHKQFWRIPYGRPTRAGIPVVIIGIY